MRGYGNLFLSTLGWNQSLFSKNTKNHVMNSSEEFGFLFFEFAWLEALGVSSCKLTYLCRK